MITPGSGGVEALTAPLNFSKMTKAQLEAYAADKGIDISGASNNAERRAMLETNGQQ